MPVHALKDDSLSVYAHHTVFHLKGSEADSLRNILHKLTILIVYRYVEKVQVRNLRAPGEHLRNLRLKMHVLLYRKSHSHKNALAGLINKLISDCSCYISFDFKFTVKCACTVVLLKTCLYKNIPHMCVRHGIDEHITEYSGKSEKVLILKPARTAVLVHLNRKLVSFLPYKRCYVPLRRREAVLRISYKGAVYPHIECLLNTLERYVGLFSKKCLIHIKIRHI